MFVLYVQIAIDILSFLMQRLFSMNTDDFVFYQTDTHHLVLPNHCTLASTLLQTGASPIASLLFLDQPPDSSSLLLHTSLFHDAGHTVTPAWMLDTEPWTDEPHNNNNNNNKPHDHEEEDEQDLLRRLRRKYHPATPPHIGFTRRLLPRPPFTNNTPFYTRRRKKRVYRE